MVFCKLMDLDITMVAGIRNFFVIFLVCGWLSILIIGAVNMNQLLLLMSRVFTTFLLS
jgi:hypothetical protein